MRELTLPSGNTIPVLGLGTWRMGERPNRAAQEEDAIRAALDMGVRLIDTAEMYGEGGAEELIGKAIRGRRDGLFLVSKFYPQNASRDGVIRACERSLRRMDCDLIDCYLLHWPGSIPLEETFDGLHELMHRGWIRDFGVSNFDLDDLNRIPRREQKQLGCNQVFYNLAHREAEWVVNDWCRQRGVPVMAYSPLDQAGSMLGTPPLDEIAGRHGATPAQIALAWLLQRENTVVIPKSAQVSRIRENLGALDIELDPQDLADLDRGFAPPRRAVRLGMR